MPSPTGRFAWERAIKESTMRATAKHVALTIATFMDADGAGAFPGADRLAGATSLTAKTVRVARAELVDAGFLVLVERGGKVGESRRANAYRATIPNAAPGNVGDGSPVVTGHRENGHPGISRPVTGNPRSPHHVEIPIPTKGRSAANGAPDPRIGELVAHYVERYQSAHNGERPGSAWIKQAGAKAKEALRDGRTVDDIRLGLNACVNTNKAPSTLTHQLADLDTERAKAKAS